MVPYPDYMEHGGVSRNWRAVAAGVIGVLVIAAYAIAGALQILIWNPLAAVPGKSLEQIRAEMAAVGESMGEPAVYGMAVIGTGLALTVLAAALLGWIKRPKTVVLLILALLALGTVARWVASFPAGMGIADTFATHGGDHAPWGWMLHWVSVAAFLALLLVALLGRRRGAAAGQVVAEP